ncbi:MFS transporter [Bradyrhizobium sp. LHD-71]|uniref:MFS transporter n=1 Tax=Bradyrhizobium sp. LHD-71 TaxID=3072141 RepID=UPI00280ED2FB|nr:MFS transporter [Bradyrhizobium sp. LHD-71]MDQ8726556.1 MFS transporter [Bradyrhizobium sp. LHD-71]
MSYRSVPTALLIGNFVIGTSVVAPAGILNELSRDLHVSIREASYLIAFGSAVLCIGSPLMSWLTSNLDRRLALAGAMLVIALTHIASAFVTTFTSLLAIRMVMLLAAAFFTPQAASLAGVIAAPDKRASTVAYVFIGWSFALALGVPLITAIASRYGWPASYFAIGAIALVCFVFLCLALPARFTTPPVDLRTWADLFRSPPILTLLAISAIFACAQFMVLTFIAPLLVLLGKTNADGISLTIALYGLAGIIGSIVAARIVGPIGPFATSLIFAGSVAIGMAVWTAGSGAFLAMLPGVLIWGFGFSAINSLQQARLVLAAPELSAGAVALNTSVLYIGQAVGSAIGGVLFERGQYLPIGYLATAIMIGGLGVLLTTRPRKEARAET